MPLAHKNVICVSWRGARTAAFFNVMPSEVWRYLWQTDRGSITNVRYDIYRFAWPWHRRGTSIGARLGRFEVIDRKGPANKWQRIAGDVLSTWIVSDQLYPIINPLPISDLKLAAAGDVLVELDSFNFGLAPEVDTVGSATVIDEQDSWEWKLEAVSD